MPRQIEFTPKTREELRHLYKEACDGGEDKFEFYGAELLTDYAKHLLEYLDMVLPVVH